MASVTPYMKKLFDKVGVEMQVVRVGTYKSAVEPYMIDSISPANREQQELYLGNIWNTMVSEMAKSRGISIESLNALADSITLTMPTSKLKASRLVDRTCYRHELDSQLKRLCELDEDDDLRLASISALASNYEYRKGKDGNIAVVYAVGEIDGGSGGIQSDEIIETVEKLMKDDDVKGMVLRVNSPGGSAFGSEQIWEVLERFKKTGRPLAVSMGDYAASGGYYISCGADRIFADSVTITGSIGVFGMIPCMEELVQNKIGVNVSVVKTNANAEMGATSGILSKKFTPMQQAAMQNYVNQTYDLFTKRCADGRNMPQDSIKKIAEGRVWDAKSAMERKLIDAYGSLDDAIAWVAQKAGLANDRYGVITAPAIEMTWRTMLTSFASQKAQQKLQKEMGIFYEFYEQLQAILNRRHVLCLMQYSEIK
jgi:protease-4